MMGRGTNEDGVTLAPNAPDTLRRKRQFTDLLDLAVMYTEKGLLSKLPSSHADYFSKAAEEFSVVAAVPPCGARRVLSLMGIRENRGVCQYLSDHMSLRVFQASELAKGNRSVNSAGGTMDIDLLRR